MMTDVTTGSYFWQYFWFDCREKREFPQSFSTQDDFTECKIWNDTFLRVIFETIYHPPTILNPVRGDQLVSASHRAIKKRKEAEGTSWESTYRSRRVPGNPVGLELSVCTVARVPVVAVEGISYECNKSPGFTVNRNSRSIVEHSWHSISKFGDRNVYRWCYRTGSKYVL